MTDIRGILFDLGDTLLDFGPVDTMALFEQGARLTYKYLQNLGCTLPAFEKYHRRQLRAVRWAYFVSTVTRREFNARDVIHKLVRGMGIDLDESQLTDIAWLWYQPLSGKATVEDCAISVLTRISEAGLKLGIISNTFIPGSALDRHLAAEDLLQFFPVRVYSCDFGRRKPSLSIFQFALEQLGTTAGQTAFVGDSPKADIFGAQRAGLFTILKDPSGNRKHYRTPADKAIRSLAQLPEALGLATDTASTQIA